ncbi:MAG: heme-binding protein [Novosphingobium sp.]
MQFKPFVDSADARAAIATRLAEADALGLAVSLAVVDAGGYPVALHRMDGAGLLTAEVALRKARAAALLRAPSRVLADRVAGDPALLALTDYLPMAGGVPITAKTGAVAGAVGVSGGTAEQDEQIAAAAVAG